MIEKDIALDILIDIRENILNKNEKQILQAIEIYKKNIEITTNLKIGKLINRQNEIIEKYGENSLMLKFFKKRISKEITKIFNK